MELTFVFRDGCVYMKENSGNAEYCFKPSSTYTAQCQDNVALATSGENRADRGQISGRITFALVLNECDTITYA